VDRPERAHPLIAVIDNEEALLTLLDDLFEDRGWGILPLPEGPSAFEGVKSRQPNVILLDIWLGGMVTGWQLLEDLKTDPQTRTIPVGVWSGASDHLQDKKDWLAERGIPVLAKPFEIDGLYEILELAMDRTMNRPQPR
jgi:CheY-like chemotaxis protein